MPVFDALLRTISDVKSGESVDVRVKRCPRKEGMPLFCPVSRHQARASGHGRSCTGTLVFKLSLRQSQVRNRRKDGEGHSLVWQDLWQSCKLVISCGSLTWTKISLQARDEAMTLWICNITQKRDFWCDYTMILFVCHFRTVSRTKCFVV